MTGRNQIDVVKARACIRDMEDLRRIRIKKGRDVVLIDSALELVKAYLYALSFEGKLRCSKGHVFAFGGMDPCDVFEK